MNTKYTPGPWSIDTYRPGDKELFISDAGATIDIDDCTVEERAERFANADLIAAAPDLLEALIHLAEKEWFKDPTFTGKHVICGLDSDKVRNAILKATGAARP